MNKQTEIIKALVLERERQSLAKKGDYSALLSKYKGHLPEIPNFNTGSYWNHRNFETDTSKKNNPMAWDKTSTAVKWILSLKKVKKVLDVGFGPGVLENRILTKTNNYEWHGIDISQKSVDYVSKKFPNSTFLKQEITNIKFHDNSYDLIIASEVLEHIPPSKIFKALTEIGRVLKRGGYFILSIPLNEGLEKLLKKGENPIQHVRIYTPELISAELFLAGFSILKMKFLYAFRKYYYLKSFISKVTGVREPNNLIILATKC